MECNQALIRAVPYPTRKTPVHPRLSLRVRTAILVPVIVLPSACSGSDSIAGPIPGPGPGGGNNGGTPTITATSASVAGYRAVGDSVHVFADYLASNASQLFDHWSGDVGVLADPTAEHTTFIWNAQSVRLTAVYRTIAPWHPVQTTVSGVDFWYYVPQNPNGIIFAFHGSGGSAANWFTHAENLRFSRAAVADGYGVAALSSHDRTSQQWTLTPISTANPDVQNVQSALARLQASGLISPSTPRYAVGASNGGRMTVRIAQVLGWNAVVNYVSQGDPDTLMMASTTPTAFYMRRNDSQALVNWQDAQRYSMNMQARGVPSEFVLWGRSPLYPKKFARIPGIDDAASIAIFNALNAAGLMDAGGYLLSDPTTNPGPWQAAIPPAYRGGALSANIGALLDDAFAEHGFFSDMNERALAFIKRHP
ncbi:MAG: hypothetical protein MNPFHGCM_02973 [Gemmatimonadaceae bacterium]|nr:hypothetical protein [Gemmatimonadaceae bacterium]